MEPREMQAATFEKIYDALLPALRELEDERQAAASYARKVGMNLLIATGGVIVVIVLVSAASQAQVGMVFVVGLIGWAIIAGALYQFTAGKRKSEYRERFKTQVIQGMVHRMEPGIHYTGRNGISKAVFDGSGLFDHRADRYQSEDGFSGRIGKTEVIFSEVKAEYKRTTTDSKGRRRTTYHTFFDGLFMVADFHKDFRSPVLVLPDVAERTLGLLGKKLQSFRPFSDDKLVYMEDPEFEKHFVVYGSDQVEARYILSTAMLRRILDLKEKWKDDVRLGFRRSTVQIAISHGGNLLEPRMKQSALDESQIRQLYIELECCFNVVEDLNLNTRVWAKE